jgi:hypothetical protein
MAKDIKEKTSTRERSPIAMAKEALETEFTPPPDVPVLSLDGDIMTEVNRELSKQAAFQLQRMKQNVVDTALAETEIHKVETLKRLKTEQAANAVVTPPTPVAPLPVGGGGGILSGIFSQSQNQPSPAPGGGSPSPVGPDRVAMLKSVLESFESDEARTAFINAHPELFVPAQPLSQSPQSQPSPYSPYGVSPGVNQPYYPSPYQQLQPQPPQQQSSAADSVGIIQTVSAMLIDQLRQGMELQRAVSPQPSQQSQQDVMQLATAFKEMQDKSLGTFQGIIKEQQEQNKGLAELVAKQKEEYAQKITELEISIRERDNEHLTQQILELREALNRPRGDIPVSDVKAILAQVRENGVPVNIDTAEQERIRAQTARENRELEHKLEMEKENLALQRIREERRADTMRSATAFLGGMFESRAMSKHSLSSNAAKLVAGGE